MEFSEWRRSMAVSLSSVNYDGYIQSRCISIVPEVLKKIKRGCIYTKGSVDWTPIQGKQRRLASHGRDQNKVHDVSLS